MRESDNFWTTFTINYPLWIAREDADADVSCIVVTMHGYLAAVSGNFSEGAGGMKTTLEYMMAQGNEE
jgi:hypothetical protein